MKQKFNLGDAVWAFKQQGKELKKVYGVVQSAEIDASGFVFYKISTLVQTKEGISIGSITANHASIAYTEEEINKMIDTYHAFQEAQKQAFEETFGGNEFEPDFIEKILKQGV